MAHRSLAADEIGAEFFERLTITDNEKIAVINQLLPQAREQVVGALYTFEVPAPSAIRGLEENIADVAIWYESYSRCLAGFIEGLADIDEEELGRDLETLEPRLMERWRHAGSVSLIKFSPSPAGLVGIAAPQWTRRLHDGPVTDVFLDAEEQVITGSADRSVCVTPLSAIRSDAPAPGAEAPDAEAPDAEAPDAETPAIQRLHLRLRCTGVRFDGVRTQHEQEKLRRYADS